MFLYESLDKGVDRKETETWLQHIEAGGFIGWVIVALGALGFLMVVIRALLLWTAAANTTRLVEQCTPLVEKRRYDDAIGLCQRARSAGGRVLMATLKNLERDRDELEDIISEAVLHETPTLDRFSSLITVIAAVAPLLGLLGTVTGMIATFDIITEFGTGNPKLLSGGIAIALITTELGLIVAIPMLILGNLCSAWANGIKDGMDKAALRIVNVSTGVRISERPRPAAAEVDSGEPAVSGA
jgi:biopolymer transport protein ExbB